MCHFRLMLLFLGDEDIFIKNKKEMSQKPISLSDPKKSIESRFLFLDNENNSTNNNHRNDHNNYNAYYSDTL